MTTRSFLPNDYPLINALTHCADCNKEAEPFKLRMCTACCSSYYCNVDCQKAHRNNHKHQCNQDVQFIKRMAVNLAKTHRDIKENSNSDGTDCDNNNDDDDDELFHPIPPRDDCPICILPLPIDNHGSVYNPCCGNLICSGCCEKDVQVTMERGLIKRCPFCREPYPLSNNEYNIRNKKRMDMNDSVAIYQASEVHNRGEDGLPRDPQKALKLCLRAAELGNSGACGRAAHYYNDGIVVPKDMTKSREYLQKAIKNGEIKSRHNLGSMELEKDNYHLASRHLLISAAAGLTLSLVAIADFYKIKGITKKEYSTALASYIQVHKDEWSIEREAAAATP